MIKIPHVLLAFDWYDHRIHQGVVNVAQKEGWSLLCLQKGINNQLIPPNWHGDGAITLIHDDETADFFRKNKIPVVDLGLSNHKLKIPRVVPDNETIGRLAAEHFMERGFSSFYALDPGEIMMFQERLAGFRKTLREHGYTCSIIDIPNIYTEPLLNDPPKKWSKKLKELQRPCALFAYEDSWAAQWIDLLNLLKIKVPQQVAVLGADNNPLIANSLFTPVSSIDTNQEGVGEKAAIILADLMNGKLELEAAIYRHPPVGTIARASTDTVASPNPVVSQALTIIHEDLEINAAELANRMNMTSQGLQRAFRAHYHMSPGQMIRELRTRRIKYLLCQSELTLEEIAYETGFSTAQAFHLYFKRETGITPGKYRKES